MENEDYRTIVKSNITIKCFRDGRIETLFIYKDGKERWTPRIVKGCKKGYIRIQIGGIMYFAHRLIMEAFCGESEQDVDHIDRNPSNNNFHNLRYCTSSENNLNRDCCDNAKGCYWHKTKKKWQAQISIDGKYKYLGYFDNEHDAHQAFLEAKALRNMN